MKVSIHLIRNMLIGGFFMYCMAAQGQNISANDIFYLNYLRTDTAVNDSILEVDVRILFSGHNDSISKILEDPADTGFYATLRNNILLIAGLPITNYEFNLHSIRKKGNAYYLKCMVLYIPKDLGITDLVGFVYLPFRLHGQGIKFGNYFKEESEQKFIRGKASNIYTNKENEGNLGSIVNYVAGVSAKYSIPIDTTHKLFYIYYPGNKDPYEMVGVENFAGADQGRGPSFGKYTLIFDKLGNGFYKHELVHFADEPLHLTGLFNEGFATYLAGSSWKCTTVCEYQKLLHFLETNTADSVILKIIKNRYADNTTYQVYFYAIGSLTTQLMERKYGNKFFENKMVAQIVTDKNPYKIYSFITGELVPAGKPVKEFYISELKKYLETNKEK